VRQGTSRPLHGRDQALESLSQALTDGVADGRRRFLFVDIHRESRAAMTVAASSSRTVGGPSTLLLMLIASLSPLTMHIYLPSLPGLAEDLRATDAQVQLTLSVYLFAVAAAQLIIGPLSDRFGRRPVLLGGVVIFLVATLWCRFATSIDSLIIARAFQAIGGCTGMVLSRAIVRDVSTRAGAASLLGYVTMGMALAQMMGPAIGGLLDGFYGWRASFDLLLVLGLVVFGFCYFLLRETNQNRQISRLSVRALAHSHLVLLKEPRFWAFALTGALASAVFFAFLGGGPIISQRDFGLRPVDYGLYFMVIAAGYAIGNYLSARFSERLGPPVMITTGNVMALGSLVAMAVAVRMNVSHPLVLFAPMMVTSLANGLCLPNSISGALSVRADLAGTASGIAGSVQLGIGALATVLVGAMIAFGISALSTIMLAFAITALIAGVLANRMEATANARAEVEAS
jgi:DHA1 family bicyclomycin/chloramphenicol resistance-like MFS transporter